MYIGKQALANLSGFREIKKNATEEKFPGFRGNYFSKPVMGFNHRKNNP